MPNIKGNVTQISGAKPKPHERITADALADAGYDVKFIPSNSLVGMADSYINNTLFEFKAPEGASTKSVERNIVKAINHQCPNIVIDTFRLKNVQDRSVQSFLLTRLKEGKGIKRIILVNRKREVIDINALV